MPATVIFDLDIDLHRRRPTTLSLRATLTLTRSYSIVDLDLDRSPVMFDEDSGSCPTRSVCNVDDGLYVYVAVQVDVWDNVNVNLNGRVPLLDI